MSANIEYNAATTLEVKAEAALHHREANEVLYGKPDEATFYSLLKDKLSLIDVDTLSDENRAKYEALLDKIGLAKEMETERFRPKPETVHRFGELVNEFFGGFLRHLPETQETFAGEDMARITNEIMELTRFGNTSRNTLTTRNYLTIYSSLVSLILLTPIKNAFLTRNVLVGFSETKI